jgi:hypothetical protein
VTFLFTDIEGSTRLLQKDEPSMRKALARHDLLLGEVIADHGGVVFATMGDGLAAAFQGASAAASCAVEAQRRLDREPWGTLRPLRVRMGLHTGEAERRDGDYFGTEVNRTARLVAVGHGGQILCSSATAELADWEMALVDLGEHRLRDLDRAIHVFQVGDGSFPPLRSLSAFPGNLPIQLTSFVGRQEELTALAQALQVSRLVTLTDTGGVGKSRLAVEAAAQLVTSFPEGWCRRCAFGESFWDKDFSRRRPGAAPREVRTASPRSLRGLAHPSLLEPRGASWLQAPAELPRSATGELLDHDCGRGGPEDPPVPPEPRSRQPHHDEALRSGGAPPEPRNREAAKKIGAVLRRRAAS